MYPAGGAYVMSNNLVFFLATVAEKHIDKMIPLEDVFNGILLDMAEESRQFIYHDRTFNIDGVIDKSDHCRFDHYVAVHMCPSGCEETEDGAICECMAMFERLWDQARHVKILLSALSA